MGRAPASLLPEHAGHVRKSGVRYGQAPSDGAKEGLFVQKLVLLGLAGAMGSLARYGLAGFVQRATPGTFPLGTFVVNVLGCLAFGFIWGVCENRISLHPDVRVVVLTGFMGAFTTFSTFTFETLGLMETGQWVAFALYAGGQLLLGLAMLWLGLGAGRLV